MSLIVLMKVLPACALARPGIAPVKPDAHRLYCGDACAIVGTNPDTAAAKYIVAFKFTFFTPNSLYFLCQNYILM
jgi:hypothetical protein